MLKRERLTGDEQTKGCMAVGDLPTDIFSGSVLGAVWFSDVRLGFPVNILGDKMSGEPYYCGLL